MLSGLTQKLKIILNNEPILTSTLAAGIVLDTFAGGAGDGKGVEEEMTGDYLIPLLLLLRREILPFLST